MIIDNTDIQRADVVVARIDKTRFLNITEEKFTSRGVIPSLIKNVDTFICADYECFDKNVRDKIDKIIKNNGSDS